MIYSKEMNGIYEFIADWCCYLEYRKSVEGRFHVTPLDKPLILKYLNHQIV